MKEQIKNFLAWRGLATATILILLLSGCAGAQNKAGEENSGIAPSEMKLVVNPGAQKSRTVIMQTERPKP